MSKIKKAVTDVLEHKQPEYIPLGTYAIDCDTVEKIVGHETFVRNKVRMQIALWEGRRDEVVQSLKEDSVELFKKLSCIDIILPFKEAPLLPPRNYEPEKVKKIGDNTWEAEDGTVYRASEISNDITAVSYSHDYRLEDFRREPDCTPPDETIFEAYDYLITNFKDTRFLAGMPAGYNPMLLLGGTENGLLQYYENPCLVKASMDYYLKEEEYMDRYYIREGVDAIFLDDDFATTQGPLMSPELFRQFCFPVMKARVEQVKRYRNKVFHHCCGNTWKLLDMFVEAGVDCYQSMQTGAGMDIRPLKEKYGDKLCFWGGVGVENLISGTQGDVRLDVRYAMQHGAPGGGFILGPSHSVAFGVKYDNFMAMLDEYDKLKYRV